MCSSYEHKNVIIPSVTNQFAVRFIAQTTAAIQNFSAKENRHLANAKTIKIKYPSESIVYSSSNFEKLFIKHDTDTFLNTSTPPGDAFNAIRKFLFRNPWLYSYSRKITVQTIADTELEYRTLSGIVNKDQKDRTDFLNAMTNILESRVLFVKKLITGGAPTTSTATTSTTSTATTSTATTTTTPTTTTPTTTTTTTTTTTPDVPSFPPIVPSVVVDRRTDCKPPHGFSRAPSTHPPYYPPPVISPRTQQSDINDLVVQMDALSIVIAKETDLSKKQELERQNSKLYEELMISKLAKLNIITNQPAKEYNFRVVRPEILDIPDTFVAERRNISFEFYEGERGIVPILGVKTISCSIDVKTKVAIFQFKHGLLQTPSVLERNPSNGKRYTSVDNEKRSFVMPKVAKMILKQNADTTIGYYDISNIRTPEVHLLLPLLNVSVTIGQAFVRLVFRLNTRDNTYALELVIVSYQ